ncbi:NADPH-dependent FMN reductase [Wenyingzhuangia sp. IMCC45574]
MKKVIVLGGSNSKNSINKQFGTYASSLLSDVEVKVLDLNDYALPIYSIDIETEEGIHPEATKFNDDLQTADAYIISLAEHNGSYSAAFKNAYDWASRINQKVWGDKPVLLLATSPGARGGATVLETAKAGFPYMGAKVVGDFALPSFYDNFSGGVGNGKLKDELTVEVSKLQDALQ